MTDRNETHDPAAETPTPASDERTGFCQECGRSLSIETLRRVGNGVFCVPCAVRHAAPAWQPVSPASATAAGVPGPGYLNGRGGPNPARAAFLGLIPGVGAMYNGQYAKGALHLVVFVILLSLGDNLNGAFYWFVWGWVFYQSFDAYHTARARRDGLPLPNPFGWNDLGDRLGIGTNRSSAPTPQAAPAYPQAAAPAGPPPSAQWAGYTAPPSSAPVSSRPFADRPDHPGENPYAEPTGRSTAAGSSAFTSNASVPPFVPPGMEVPYRPIFAVGVPPPVPASTPITGVRRFPMGALWLIGLGVLFLLGNLLPEWRVSARWLVPLLLAAIAIWSALRRWDQFRSMRGSVSSPLSFAGAVVGPTLLLSVAALLALHAGEVLSMRRSWPILLVVWGGLLAIQRSAAAAPSFPNPAELPGAGTPPPPARSTAGTGSLGL